MKHYLFVTSPFVAHINPMVSVGRELSARGNAVAWVAHRGFENLLPSEHAVFTVGDRDLLESIEDAIEHGHLDLGNAFKYLVESIIVPLARSMRPRVESAIEQFRPDAMLVDHHALAGAIAARKTGIPWATSAPSAQLFTDVLDNLERVNAWVQEQFAEVQRESGLDPIDSPDCSADLVLLYTTPALVGEREFPPQYRFVGATIRGRVDDPEFPWERLDPGRRKVLVSLGSLMSLRGERFFKALEEGLRDTDFQVIVSAPPGLIPEPPPNFIVRQWLPQLKLLPEVDAVITHGGSTVNEALAFAVPMVVAPITTDQFVYARCVDEAGAGIRVRFRRVSATELRDAVTRVIEDPSYAEAARRIQFSYAAAGGTHAAADALEALATSQAVV